LRPGGGGPMPEREKADLLHGGHSTPPRGLLIPTFPPPQKRGETAGRRALGESFGGLIPSKPVPTRHAPWPMCRFALCLRRALVSRIGPCGARGRHPHGQRGDTYETNGDARHTLDEIGRASCRERVWRCMVAVSQ